MQEPLERQAYTEAAKTLPEVLIDPTPEELDRMTPSVSVDRTLAHMLDQVDVDLDKIREFYYSLPHENKPDLEQLHIHFSATRPTKYRSESSTFGIFMPIGAMGSMADYDAILPELEQTESPTIVVYMGSLLTNKVPYGFEFNRLSPESADVQRGLDLILSHELTHFAQLGDMLEGAQNPEGLLASARNFAVLTTLRGLRRAFEGWRDIATGLAAAGVSEYVYDAGAGSVVVGGVVAGASHVMHRRQQLQQRSSREFKQYMEREQEVDARAHEQVGGSLASATVASSIELPEWYDATDLEKPNDKRRKLRRAAVKHTHLAYTPRGMHPQDVEGVVEEPWLQEAITVLTMADAVADRHR